KAFDFIKANAQNNTPFFCYIPTAIPHAAMHAPKQLHKKWQQVFPSFNDTIGRYSAGKEDKCPPVVNPIAGFAGMMEHLDTQVGELLVLLSDLGIDENTMIVFTSDNGAHREGGHMPHFWNSTGGLRGGKRDLHEGGIRVPMIVRWPGKIKPGIISDHISGFHDVLPTMAEIVGQTAPAMAEGLSFLPELTNLEQKEHESIVIDYYQRNNLVSRAVRMGKWKAFLKGNKKELYNLEEDPFEENNIIESNPDIMQKIYHQIEQNSDTISRRHLIIPKKGKM
ncbi:MAG: sulfatase-like hydrolase/transferase, partial [Bacteroidales bacterium]|nr:sulfatase-like hydrolase/transferase [Bacteroidales bacterium]